MEMCDNSLNVTCKDRKRLEEFAESIRSESSPFDFRKVIDAKGKFAKELWGSYTYASFYKDDPVITEIHDKNDEIAGYSIDYYFDSEHAPNLVYHELAKRWPDLKFEAYSSANYESLYRYQFHGANGHWHEEYNDDCDNVSLDNIKQVWSETLKRDVSDEPVNWTRLILDERVIYWVKYSEDGVGDGTVLTGIDLDTDTVDEDTDSLESIFREHLKGGTNA